MSAMRLVLACDILLRYPHTSFGDGVRRDCPRSMPQLMTPTFRRRLCVQNAI